MEINYYFVPMELNVDTNKAVGVKVYVGEYMCEGYDYQKFLDNCTCTVSGVDTFDETEFTCRYYDDETGYVYFHFDKPISSTCVEEFFDADEIIYEIVAD
jgi:hypothetical protein